MNEAVKLFSVDFTGNIFTYANSTLKYRNSSGVVQWSKPYTGDLIIKAMICDASGSLYFAGEFTNFTFNSQTFTSSGAEDAFFGKLNSSGTLVWSKTYNGPGTEIITDIAIGNSKLILSGNAGSGSVIEGTVFTENALFVASYELTGTSTSFKKVKGAYSMEIESDNLGNVYLLSGLYETDSVNLGPAMELYGCGSCMGSHFMAKLDHTGSGVWAMDMGTNYYGPFENMVVDGSGSIYLSDWQRYNGFIVRKFNNSGVEEWEQHIPGTYGSCNAMVVDHSDSLWLTGSSWMGDDGPNPFLWQFDDGGNVMVEIPESNSQSGNLVATDQMGGVYVAGNFADSAQFGSTVFTGNGFFLAKLNRSPSVVTSVSDIEHHDFKIFPNPAGKEITLKWWGMNGDVNLSIYNSLGVCSYKANLTESSNEFKLEVSFLSPGIYTSEIVSGKSRKTQKLIIQ
ncbi:MAG: T9SS type A sorting domain-containing protein [Bacteroidota bacterium]|nr:T9SS type A sorting domain-containing protein [Bacteroidota bacterium]